MTTAFILTALAAVFVIGFLLGDRRGVKQCNAILDENWRELMKTIKEESPLAEPTETDKAVPTLHSGREMDMRLIRALARRIWHDLLLRIDLWRLGRRKAR